MKRCVLFSTDPHLVTQVRAWAKAIDRTYRIDIFSSFEDFKNYRRAGEDGQRSEFYERDIVDGADGMLVRLLIVDADLLSENLTEDLRLLHAVTKELGLVAAIEPPRILVMGYETGVIRLDQFQTDLVDSLILKPLDRELFCQNIEFLAAEDPFVEPSFLFTAPTDMVVEVGKDIVVEELAEYGLAIRNPFPLQNGVFATIHCDALGVGGSARVHGRVYKSRPHPVRKGEWIVYLLFFGITDFQLGNVRRYVNSEQTMAKITKTAPKRLDLDLIAPPDRRFAVIDMNPESLDKTLEILEGGFKNATVRGFSSFSRLQAELISLTEARPAYKVAPEAQANGGAKTAAFPGGKIYLTIRSHTAELVTMDPQFPDTQTVLGRPQKDFLASANLWFTCIENDDKAQVVELIGAAERGVNAQALFRMKDLDGRTFYIEAKGFLAKSGENGASPTVRLDLAEVSFEVYQEKTVGAAGGGADPTKFKFDAVFVDASLIAPSPEVWITTFTSLLRVAGVLGPGEEPPKFIVLSDDTRWMTPEAVRQAGYSGYCFKPLDRRYVLLTMQALIPDLKWHRELDTIPNVKVEMGAKLAKELKLTEMSEYGLTVEQKSPLRQGALMKFFSPLFGDQGGNWITARCRYSVKSESSETHLSRFIFFGVSDEVFQRIRRWIREDYVAKKEGA